MSLFTKLVLFLFLFSGVCFSILFYEKHHNLSTQYTHRPPLAKGEYPLIKITPIRAQNLPSACWLPFSPNPVAVLFLDDDSVNAWATFPEYYTHDPVWPTDWSITFAIGPNSKKLIVQAEAFSFSPKTMGSAELSLENRSDRTVNLELKTKGGKSAGTIQMHLEFSQGAVPVPEETPLRRHVGFFDINEDGVITAEEIKTGCVELGYSLPLSWFMGEVIAHTISSPLLSRLSHGVRHQDSLSWRNPQATWNEEAFERFWFEADTNHDGFLSLYETIKSSFRVSQHHIADFNASIAELTLTYHLYAKDGKLSKADLKAFLDGSVLRKFKSQRKASH